MKIFILAVVISVVLSGCARMVGLPTPSHEFRGNCCGCHGLRFSYCWDKLQESDGWKGMWGE